MHIDEESNGCWKLRVQSAVQMQAEGAPFPAAAKGHEDEVAQEIYGFESEPGQMGGGVWRIRSQR